MFKIGTDLLTILHDKQDEIQLSPPGYPPLIDKNFSYFFILKKNKKRKFDKL